MAFVDTELFVVNIQKYPILWDLNHEGFKNVKLKAKIWKNISAQFDISVRDAKTKWKRLRDSYIRATARRPPGENGKKYSSCWKYEKVMSFIEGTVRPRNKNLTCKKEDSEIVFDPLESSDLFNSLQDTNFGNDSFPCVQSNGSLSASESNISLQQQEQMPQEKMDSTGEQLLAAIKGVQYYCEQATKEVSSAADDEDALFGRCLAMKLRKLPLPAKNKVKLDILKLVCDEEERLNLE